MELQKEFLEYYFSAPVNLLMEAEKYCLDLPDWLQKLAYTPSEKEIAAIDEYQRGNHPTTQIDAVVVEATEEEAKAAAQIDPENKAIKMMSNIDEMVGPLLALVNAVEQQKVKPAFELYDADKSGAIDKKELQ